MSADTPDMDDDQLLGELRRLAARADAPPLDLLDAGRATFTWRRLDAELAELLHDSAHDSLVVRGAAGTERLLSFEASQLTAEVQVSEHEGARRLIGQLIPPGPASVEIRHASGSVHVDADEMGRFTAEVPAGHVSLRIGLAGRGAVETAWVDI